MRNKFVIIARERNWISGFAVEAGAADFLVKCLNDREGDDGDWIIVTVEMEADEIGPTFKEWQESSIQ